MADQTKVEKLLEVVTLKKAEIAKATKPYYITNLTYPFSKNDTVNLATITNEGQLVDVLSDLIHRSKSYEAAAEILGVKGQFKIGVNSLYSFDEWVEDLKTRLLVINLRKNKELLEKLETELSKLESPEVKEARKLQEIESLLKQI